MTLTAVSAASARSAVALALTLTVWAAMFPAAAHAAALRVCADPNYLPYSNQARQGWENKVAAAVAKDLGESLSYTWATTRGTGGWDQFIHDTLNAGKCDVVMNVPYANQALLTSDPYYISSYVFVFDKRKNYDLRSLDSSILQRVKIGYESDTPPESGLKLRGILLGAVPFDIGGTEGQSPAVMLDAVRSNHIQVGITWEPAVGYFLKNRYSQLAVVPVPNSRGRGTPEQYIFPMSMGVRQNDQALKKRLNQVIARHKSQLVSILDQYGVKLYRPNVDPYGSQDQQ
ncbi:MAG: quinoprotein dehydrogenase-associated putative ABC transporter substrate-binding protein [Candidatus Eremiobacter antarcticus]|nr:transporter substrate-binding domain-containing protein [Candidatus Eremiobacteraeota bacterium]MBC5808302.1 transporter substrate-binding domain-containing protein [Candidatus Eremiobacteraeota bacterium]PZR63674.1 MAG: quinoprotein dehydrogenase-associated putative ABC transporter substrate-binding protein [Candidatus Eremiobacter sp. RRmetagenome_bin22]